MGYDHSDYGSGSSLNSNPWSSQEEIDWASFQKHVNDLKRPKASSFKDLLSGRVTLGDVMKEFQMNGSDSPYHEDDIWSYKPEKSTLSGMGPPTQYLRQKSWPAPDITPLKPLPRSDTWGPVASGAGNPIGRADKFQVQMAPQTPAETLTEEQRRVLNTLPREVVYSLLKDMEQNRDDKGKKRQLECRFCKNNGERESYYKSHVLRSADGRVSCPVLRAYRCGRCHATGDLAHTIKYCPYSTREERLKSAAIMRSVRMASGRRRLPPSADEQYILFGETPQTIIQDNSTYSYVYGETPLAPLWAALEKKLML